MLPGRARHRGHQPHVGGVRADRDRQPRRLTGVGQAEFDARVLFELGELAGEADYDLAGLGQLDRPGAQQQDAADPVFQRLDPLADRGRRDVQGVRGRVEGAFVDGGEQGADLVQRQFGHHIH